MRQVVFFTGNLHKAESHTERMKRKIDGEEGRRKRYTQKRLFLQPQRRRLTARSFWRVRCNGLLGHIRRPRSDFYQLGPYCTLSDLSVISSLRTKPITVGQTEEAAKPQISISSDAALSRDDISNTLGRNIDFLCQSILAYTHGFKKLLQEEFTGSDRFEFSHMDLSSVVIHYFYVFNACIGPAETDTPLIIDTNAVLPFSFAHERFKAIARGYPQVVQSARDLKLPKFSLCHCGNAYKSPDTFAFRQRLRIRARKRFDHAL